MNLGDIWLVIIKEKKNTHARGESDSFSPVTKRKTTQTSTL